MTGISSKSAGKLNNRRKFNGIEDTTGFEINIYDAFFRNADPQIGRRCQIDPKPNRAENPYSMMGNNPNNRVAFMGDTPTGVAPIIIPVKSIPDVYQNHLNYLRKHPNEAIPLGNMILKLFDYEPNNSQERKCKKIRVFIS